MQKDLKTVILTAFAIETFSATLLLEIPHAGTFCAILWFLSGLGIGAFLLLAPALSLPHFSWKADIRLSRYRLITAVLLAIVLFDLSRLWFDELPLEINYADMLPIIKVMGQRVLSGHSAQVYDPISSIWGGVQPIYLPAMWLPFIPAVALDIDLRWVTTASLLVTFTIFLFIYKPKNDGYRSFLIGVMAFLLFWWICINNTSGILTASEEAVVTVYYILLVLALLSGNALLVGLTASLCMLSRYALAGWIPAYLLYLALAGKWKQAAIFILTGMVCFASLFLLPAGWPTFLRLLKLPGNYIAFAARVWRDSPKVFSSGLGLAGLFGPKHTTILHTLLIALSFLVPPAVVVYGFRRNKKKMTANIPLASLKIALVIFYSFIDVPYLYLFYTSSFVSLVLVTLVIQQNAVRFESGDAGR